MIEYNIVWKGVGHVRPCLLLVKEEVMIRLFGCFSPSTEGSAYNKVQVAARR